MSIGTLIKNVSGGDLFLPAPYNKPLKWGQSVSVNDTVANVTTNLGGAEGFARILELQEVDQASFDMAATGAIPAAAYATVAALADVAAAEAAGTSPLVPRGDHVHAHGNQTTATHHAAATNAANGFESSARVLRHEQQLASVSRLFLVTPAPAAKGAADVHAAVLATAPNAFPGPITNPGWPRNLIATFGALWDGGDITVDGTDQHDAVTQEVLASNPGGTTVGAKIFKTVTAITKGAVGVVAIGASVGQGDKLGVAGNIAAGSPAQLTTIIGGAYAREAVVLDAANDAFTPTTTPDGATEYELNANL